MTEIKTSMGDTIVNLSGNGAETAIDTIIMIRAIYNALKSHDPQEAQIYRKLFEDFRDELWERIE